MTNVEIVELLRNVVAALTIKDVNRFRIIAYTKAADAIEQLTSEVKDLWNEDKLELIPGVGKGIASALDELFKTGGVKHFEEIFSGISPALFVLLKIPGLGPKRAYQLTQTFQIYDPKSAVDILEKVAKLNKIGKLEGWGEKSQTQLLSAIATFRKGQIKENRMPLPLADMLAQELIAYLSPLPQVERVDVLGSLRRKVATIGDIDMAVATNDPEVVLDAFVKFPKVRKITDKGPKGATVQLLVGRQVDLRVQTPQAYGAMLQYFTGSKYHNIKLRELALKKGLSLNEHGIKRIKAGKTIPYATEEDFYKVLGMDWIPPEIREDLGEIEASLRHTLPKLVGLTEIKGDLHIHSNYDLKPSHDLGSSSFEELLNQAVSQHYEYIGISDHNPKVSDLKVEQIIDIMKRRKHAFEQFYSSWENHKNNRVHFFTMLEVDIDPKGKLALPMEAFDYIDACVVSIHSSFTQSKELMTERILNGLSHPKAKILGHPTARLLGSRESIEADWDKIFQFCKAYNKALEINSWPERLDLPDRLVKEAISQGVKLVISTDSHAAGQMSGMQYGVDVARRGWATKKEILNTLEYNEFNTWIKG